MTSSTIRELGELHLDSIRAGDYTVLPLIAAHPTIAQRSPIHIRQGLLVTLLNVIGDSRSAFTMGVKKESAIAMRILTSLAGLPEIGTEYKAMLRALGKDEVQKLKLDRHLTSAKEDVGPAAVEFLKVLLHVLRCEPADLLSQAPAIQKMQDSLAGRAPPPSEAQPGDEAAGNLRRRSSMYTGQGVLERQQSSAALGGVAGLGSNGQSTNNPPAPQQQQDRQQQQQDRQRQLPIKPSSVPHEQNPLFDATLACGVMQLSSPNPVLLFAKHFGLGCVPKFPQYAGPETQLTFASRFSKEAPPAQPSAGPASASSANGPASPVSASSTSNAQQPLHTPPPQLQPSDLRSPTTPSAASAAVPATPIVSTNAETPQPATSAPPSKMPTMPPMIDPNSPGGQLVRRYLSSADGVLVGWGHGRCGELGNGSTTSVLTPRVIATPQRVLSIACGAQYSLWLTKSSQVYSCGAAEWGQLGIGDPSKLRDQSDGIPISPSPTLLKGFKQSDNVCGLTAGYAFGVALTDNGEMYLWGNNNHGQCSVGSQLRSDNVRVCQPLKVGMRSTKVVDVACGSFFVVVLTATNSVLSWGLVSVLGLGAEEDVIRLVDPKWVVQSSSKEKRNVVLCPCKVSSLDGKGIVQVVAGQWHVLAVGHDGAVYSWGVGHQGRLGHGTPTQEFRPRRIDALKEIVVTQAACGSFHSCILADDGRVFVFGDNACGQCGLVGQPFYLSPTLIPLLCPGIGVMCGREHTTILLSDGDVMVCGSSVANATGLGVGSKIMSPQRILTNFLSLGISCGVNHGFAMGLPRSLELVPLGLLHSGPASKITSMTLKDGLLTAALGASFSVVVNRNGESFSFGNGDWGQLGVGSPASIPDRTPENVPIVTQPQRIPLLSNVRVSAVAAGYAFAVCITEEQRVLFWGNNNHSQGGLGVEFRSTVKIDEPRDIVALAEKNVVQIACGSFFVLALTQAMEVYSWGILDCCGIGKEPSAEEVAPSTICSSMTSEARTVVAIPTKIPSLSGVITVSAGQWHAVVLTDKGHIYTWGVGHQGRLGHGDTASRFVPTRINFSVPCSGIGCGSFNSWALSTSADLYMWGDNDSGQCGYDGSETLLFPTQVASNVRSVACGRQHSVIVTLDGKVKLTGAITHQDKPYRCKNFEQAPQPPPLVGVAASNKFALQVFSGPHHAFVLVEKDRPTAPAVVEASKELRWQLKRDSLYNPNKPPPAARERATAENLESSASGNFR